MNSLKILIVEDEFITGKSLETALSRIGYTISGYAMDADEAIEILEREEVDLAILDINLQGEKTGIWLAQYIQKHIHIPFIFLTAYGDEATVKEAMKTKPCGYLVKPFETVDLYTSIQTALINYTSRNKKEPHAQQSLLAKEALFIKEEHIFIKIKFREIQFIKAAGNYLEIHIGSKPRLIRKSMKDFMKELPDSGFLRVHKSFLINLEKVEQVGPNYLTIAQTEIPIASSVRPELLERLGIA